MGTIAGTWVKQGRQEGLLAGKEEGLLAGREEGLVVGKAAGIAESLTRLLERRFGALSRSVRDRIVGARPEQVEIWLDAVLDAPDLETVFTSARH